MNRLEEIQEIIKNFIYEKQQMKQKISEIENKRAQLAQERNESKSNIKTQNAFNKEVEAKVSALGKQIAELGNQSQELQNKLDAKFLDVKNEVNIQIDTLISEGIRKIRKVEEVKEELENKTVIRTRTTTRTTARTAIRTRTTIKTIRTRITAESKKLPHKMRQLSYS